MVVLGQYYQDGYFNLLGLHYSYQLLNFVFLQTPLGLGMILGCLLHLIIRGSVHQQWRQIVFYIGIISAIFSLILLPQTSISKFSVWQAPQKVYELSNKDECQVATLVLSISSAMEAFIKSVVNIVANQSDDSLNENRSFLYWPKQIIRLNRLDEIFSHDPDLYFSLKGLFSNEIFETVNSYKRYDQLAKSIPNNLQDSWRELNQRFDGFINNSPFLNQLQQRIVDLNPSQGVDPLKLSIAIRLTHNHSSARSNAIVETVINNFDFVVGLMNAGGWLLLSIAILAYTISANLNYLISWLKIFIFIKGFYLIMGMMNGLLEQLYIHLTKVGDWGWLNGRFDEIVVLMVISMLIWWGMYTVLFNQKVKRLA